MQCVIVAFSDHTHLHFVHSGKSATILESNHGSGVCKEHST